ncbi:protein translocase subunit SecF [Candidatus Pacearchaeota archaeon]|nr:protein translocase subunit SecF [Candidatus Pacearchaeota archaeon]
MEEEHKKNNQPSQHQSQNKSQEHHQHQKSPHQTQNNVDGKNLYDRIYKWLLILPAILLIFSIIYLVQFNNKNGDIIFKDVSLTGGTTVTVFDGNIEIDKVKNSLKAEFPDLIARGISDIRTGKQLGFALETKAEPQEIKTALEKFLNYKLTNENSSVEFSGSTLSQGFYKQLRFAIILAFVLMAIVVFVIFRTPVPSGAVILSAFADIIMSLVVINMSGMQISGAGIVAFLMLIGYSVDTDILLTTRLLRNKEGTINQRILGALKTGLTMTLTAIAAVAVSLIIIYSLSDILRQMFTILLVGLGFDILNTWITNTSILKWYMEAKNIR